jgi:hypothetical protein
VCVTPATAAVNPCIHNAPRLLLLLQCLASCYSTVAPMGLMGGGTRQGGSS